MNGSVLESSFTTLNLELPIAGCWLPAGIWPPVAFAEAALVEAPITLAVPPTVLALEPPMVPATLMFTLLLTLLTPLTFLAFPLTGVMLDVNGAEGPTKLFANPGIGALMLLFSVLVVTFEKGVIPPAEGGIPAATPTIPDPDTIAE